MIRADFHMHSSFSEDSDTIMEEQIKASINKGLTAICFTEHHDPDFPKNPENMSFILDTYEYYKKYVQVKEQYSSQIEIYHGVELGLQPHLSSNLNEFVRNNNFDFIIGSTHVCDGFDVYYADYFTGKTEQEAYEHYFEQSLENIKAFNNFDVYGHIDYITRYGQNKDKYFTYSKYSDYIDALLTNLIDMGKGIEINTGAYKSGLNHPNPGIDIVKRYKELGGEIITIGADAHTPQYVASNFDKAEAILKTAGFTYYNIFSNRKAVFISI